MKIIGDIYYSKEIDCEKHIYATSQCFRKNPLKSKFYNLVTCFFSIGIKNYIKSFKILFSNIGSIKNTKKEVIDNLRYAIVQKKIKQINPDIIHFHDLTKINIDLIDYALDNNYKCILTLHLFIGKQSDLLEYKLLKEREKKFFNRGNLEKLTITCVSTKMKNRLIEIYPKMGETRISVILNGTDYVPLESINNDIKKKLNISLNRKIFLCIGGISNRKNQWQLLQVLSEMNENELKRIVVIFIGTFNKEEDERTFEKFCKKNKLEDSVKYAGPLSVKEMHNYYKQSDFVISVSKNESFGLTFIEGFRYGLPSILFYDLDAVDDLYNEKAMLLIKDRSNEALQLGIIESLNRAWDHYYISKYSKNFTVDVMAKNYLELYYDVFTSNCK